MNVQSTAMSGPLGRSTIWSSALTSTAALSRRAMRMGEKRLSASESAESGGCSSTARMLETPSMMPISTLEKPSSRRNAAPNP